MEHRHHGKSSESFLDCDEILQELNFNGAETFLDAGCGDGYISKKVVDKYLSNGKVYAVDLFSQSISELQEYVDENNIDNLIPIEADSEEEIEIRAADLEVIDYIYNRLEKKYAKININDFIWLLSQDKKEMKKPYHRTLTNHY